MTMKMSPKGRAFLTKEEGVVLTAYRDSVGVLTIGVGHTNAAGLPVVSPGLKITAKQADEILSRDLVQYENTVNSTVNAIMTQNQFDAMVSLCFNIGPGGFKRSAVAKKFNAGDVAGAADAFLSWSRAGQNKTLLLARRKRERALFLNGAYPKVTVAKTAKEAASASKQSPIATGAVITGATTGAAAILPNIASWEGVAALAVLLIAAGVGYIVWRRYFSEKSKTDA